MATCTSYEIGLPKGSPYPSQCIKGNHVTSPDDSDMNYKFAEYEPTFKNSAQVAYRLNPNGYRYDSTGMWLVSSNSKRFSIKRQKPIKNECVAAARTKNCRNWHVSILENSRLCSLLAGI